MIMENFMKFPNAMVSLIMVVLYEIRVGCGGRHCESGMVSQEMFL